MLKSGTTTAVLGMFCLHLEDVVVPANKHFGCDLFHRLLLTHAELVDVAVCQSAEVEIVCFGHFAATLPN